MPLQENVGGTLDADGVAARGPGGGRASSGRHVCGGDRGRPRDGHRGLQPLHWRGSRGDGHADDRSHPGPHTRVLSVRAFDDTFVRMLGGESAATIEGRRLTLDPTEASCVFGGERGL